MLLWLALFCAFLPATTVVMLMALRVSDRRERAKVERALAQVRADDPVVTVRVMLDTGTKKKGPFERVLERIPGLGTPSGGVAWNRKTGMILAAMAGMGIAGCVAGMSLRGWLGGGAVPLAGALCAAAPILLLRREAGKRVLAFEEQLPDALDFLARSVRTGNAFSVSLEMLVPETAEPLRAEFLRVTREQALGASLDRALRDMLKRVPVIELRFFVAAILVQKETGGNLADALNKLSISVRERLRIKGQVRASSAQGRLTARILSVLPLAVILMMNVISPQYFQTMTNDPIGRMLLLAAVVSQLIGYCFMRSIVNIEV